MELACEFPEGLISLCSRSRSLSYRMFVNPRRMQQVLMREDVSEGELKPRQIAPETYFVQFFFFKWLHLHLQIKS